MTLRCVCTLFRLFRGTWLTYHTFGSHKGFWDVFSFISARIGPNAILHVYCDSHPVCDSDVGQNSPKLNIILIQTPKIVDIDSISAPKHLPTSAQMSRSRCFRPFFEPPFHGVHTARLGHRIAADVFLGNHLGQSSPIGLSVAYTRLSGFSATPQLVKLGLIFAAELVPPEFDFNLRYLNALPIQTSIGLLLVVGLHPQCRVQMSLSFLTLFTSRRVTSALTHYLLTDHLLLSFHRKLLGSFLEHRIDFNCLPAAREGVATNISTLSSSFVASHFSSLRRILTCWILAKSDLDQHSHPFSLLTDLWPLNENSRPDLTELVIDINSRLTRSWVKLHSKSKCSLTLLGMRRTYCFLMIRSDSDFAFEVEFVLQTSSTELKKLKFRRRLLGFEVAQGECRSKFHLHVLNFQLKSSATHLDSNAIISPHPNLDYLDSGLDWFARWVPVPLLPSR
ncbi:hypothetical protein DFH06DRAFT_1294267 [Mycena polygramma]|nr:hypothetical protein DFH06DRAFT_1294267 [Mycena polygramma]